MRRPRRFRGYLSPGAREPVQASLARPQVTRRHLRGAGSFAAVQWEGGHVVHQAARCPGLTALAALCRTLGWGKPRRRRRIHACMHARTHARTHTHTHERTHTHAHTHTQTYTYDNTFSRFCQIHAHAYYLLWELWAFLGDHWRGLFILWGGVGGSFGKNE